MYFDSSLLAENDTTQRQTSKWKWRWIWKLWWDNFIHENSSQMICNYPWSEITFGTNIELAQRILSVPGIAG
jgi:hypothetical protein